MRIVRKLVALLIGLSIVLPLLFGPSLWPLVSIIAWAGFYIAAVHVFRIEDVIQDLQDDVIRSSVRSGYCAFGEDFKEECRLLRGEVSREECTRCWGVRIGRLDPEEE